MPRRPREQERVRQPGQLAATIIGATSILVTILSAGTSFAISALMSGGALWMGRKTGRRSSMVVGAVGLGLAVVAGITWSVLATQGITPADLQDTLQRALDRMRDR